MGRAREVGWMAAGLMIGAGACYCVYKLTRGKDDDKSEEEEEDQWDDDLELDEEDPEIWFDFTSMARPWSEDGDWTEPGAPGGTEDRPSGGGKANRAHPIKQRPFPYEHKNTWSAQSFQNVTGIIDLFKGPSIQGQMLFAEPKEAGVSISQDLSRHLAGLSVFGNTSPTTPKSSVQGWALRGPHKLKARRENQGQINMYLNQVYLETVSCCCSSFLQQAGLNLLISMTVINTMLTRAFSDLEFPLLAQKSSCAEAQAVEAPPRALSEKPVLARGLLGTPMPLSFPPLPLRSGNTQVLLEATVQ